MSGRHHVSPIFRLLASWMIAALLLPALPARAAGTAARPNSVIARYTFIARADQDTSVTTDTTTPWGAEPRLYVFQNGGSTSLWSALLRFDLSVVPAGSRVISATANLYMQATDSTPINIHRVSTAWDEATAIWATIGNQYDTTPAASIAPAGRGRYVQVDITALTQAWLAGASPNYGILLRTPLPASDHTLASKEAANAGQWPYLEIVVEDARIETAADDFDPNTGYAGSDGSLPWLDPWTEIAEADGPTAGSVRAETSNKCAAGACLRTPGVQKDGNRYGASRGINLAGATAAILSFSLRLSGQKGQIDLEASADGGAHWTQLKSYTLPTATTSNAKQSFNLLPYAAPDTRIRFIGAGDPGDGWLYVDNVRVDVVRQGIGGRLWDDLNQDRNQNPNEPGLRGITVNLYNTSCAGATGAAYRTVVTGGDGYYAFASLASGSYCVRVDEATLPAGYTLTTNNALVNVTLAATQYQGAVNFGYATTEANDRLTVGAYAPCADAAWLQALALTYGAAILYQDRAACSYIVQVAPAKLSALQTAIAADPHTRHVSPDRWTLASYTPNDPHFNDPTLVYGPQRIQAPAAWDVTRGNSDIIVTVVDTGVDLTHPEFAGRLAPGYDFVNGDGDPSDDNGHGTHVAGIIAAGINNGLGMAGIAGNAQLLPVKVLSARGSGWWSDIARGITWAVDQGARVVNLSLCGTSNSLTLRDAIAYANSKGAVVVAGAGNSGTAVAVYPASYESVLAVGATDIEDVRVPYSNYGVNVDVMAPGDSIWSTQPGAGYDFLSGTSMAAPHAAGVAALLLSINSNLTPAQIKERLQATAADLDAPGVDAFTGYGLINAEAAVAATPPEAPITPTTDLKALLLTDLNGNGLVDSGDTLRYRVTVANPGATPLTDVIVSTSVPLYTSYAISSTQLSGIPVRDDAAPQTILPLDEGQLNIGDVSPHSSSTISFDVVVSQPPRGVYALIGQATVTVGGGQALQATPAGSVQTLEVVTPVAGALLQATVSDANARISQMLTYSLTTDYLGNNLLSNVVVTAAVPAGTSYVAGSANAGGTESGGTVTWNLGGNTAGSPGFAPGVSSVIALDRTSTGAALKPVASPSLGNVVTAAPTLVTSGGAITVTQTLTASEAIANVSPTALTITGTNGVVATLLSGPAPISATAGISGTTFTWVYRATAAAAIGQLAFGGRAAGGGNTWPWAQSNSIIVHPALTFAATVNSPATVSPVVATAYIKEAGQIPLSPSNTVQTTIQASIGDIVWSDLNGDGVQDVGEPGINGVEVCAIPRTGGPGGGCAASDPWGYYRIHGLTESVEYTVSLTIATAPANYLATTPPVLVRTATTAGVNDADFGLRALATLIGDTLWYDADADGVQDIGEPGLGNVTLALYRDDGDGVYEPGPGLGRDTYVGSTVSDAAGVYALQAFGAGSYFVDVTDDNGVLAGLNHTIGPQSMAEPSPPITVNLGDLFYHADFGYVRASAAAIIGDLVWLDGNGNRVREISEPILIGVNVCATPLGGGNAICALTDLNGRYLLQAPPGSYSIAPAAPPLGLPPSTPIPYTVTVAGGRQYLGADFGYSGGSAALGGTIWQDVAVEDVTDGIYNPAAEPGIANVSVNVIQDRDADGIWDPGEPILATFSGASGDYLLESLLPGDYLAQVSDTMATLRRFVVSSPGPNPGQDYNNQRQPYAVTLSAGGVNTTADFGYREYDAFAQADPPDPGVIGDLVWYDANGDGVYTPGDGDHPITGVTLALSRDGGADVTAATSGYGRYLFTDLPLGHTYTLRVTDAFGVLAGLIATTPAPNPGQDNQNQAQPYSVILGAQRQNYTADFGYTWPATTGDRVYFDLNRNGVEDAGEPGIPDVTLDLYRSGVKVASSATDATGMYTFTAPASLYTVTIAAAELAAGGTLYRWTPTSAATRPVTLTAGQVITATDFGLTILSSYTVTHRLNTSDPVRTNSPISFTVRITNTGNTWLTALAVTDLYSPTYLAYGVASRFAQPDSADHLDDGVLTWPNVLTATAGAQSLASRQTPTDAAGWLAPGASTTITLWFTTRADSFSFSPLGAANQIAVSAPRFDPDGAGPLAELPAGADLPAQAASSTVRILEPTGLTVTGFRAITATAQVTLTWQTANEAQILGFTLLRRTSGGAMLPVNREIIPAEHAGSNQGTTYTYADRPAPGAYAYFLEIIQLDGRRFRTNPVAVRVGP